MNRLAGACHRISNRRTRPRSAFTLIEVLVVVAIIGLLVSILLPSLNRARESARTVKCMSNMSNLPKATISYAAEHGGHGQLSGQQGEWEAIDPYRTRYEYQPGGTWASVPQLKCWPVAYAKHTGIPTLRFNEQFGEKNTSSKYNRDPNYYWQKFGRHDVFLCPSDKLFIHNLWSPTNIYATVSYATNEDVFGITEPPGCKPEHLGEGEGQPWRDGRRGNSGPPVISKRLEGRMDKIIRPSEVVLYCDGGTEEDAGAPLMLITNGAVRGPYLENYEWLRERLPHFRHSDKGGIAAAFADGSGKYAKPIAWKTKSDGRQFVKRYSPRIRVSPYNVGEIKYEQP